MRMILTAGAAALTCLASLGAAATPASAAPGWHGGGGGWHGGGGGWHGGGGWRGGGGRWGWGVGAGLAGFALGAALAHPYYGGPYYGGPYYGYNDGPYGYDQCVGTRRVWDPYYGGYVIRRFYYAC